MSANPPTQDAGYVKMKNQPAPPPEDISFNDDPPDKHGPELWIHRLKGNEEITCTVFGSAVRGVDTHWCAGRTQPHYKDEATCPGCIAQIRIDWKGYLHCFDWKRGRQFFLELTGPTRKKLMSQIEAGKPLRGSIIRVKRSPADNGRITVIVDKHSRRDKDLPPEVDPRLSILRLYELDDDDPDESPQLATGEEPNYELPPPPDHL